MKDRSPSPGSPLEKIVSGGQTGVDRAGLDAAREQGFSLGGWCPKGRRAEDGPIPTDYPLQETAARSYAVRTRWNVRDSDGTLIVAMTDITAGTKLTADFARRTGRPLQIVLLRPDPGRQLFDGENRLNQINTVVDWIRHHRIRVLNVAGPRGSSHADIYDEARSFLCQMLQQLAAGATD